MGIRYSRAMQLDAAREHGVLPGLDRLDPIEWHDLCAFVEERDRYEAEKQRQASKPKRKS